MKKTVKVLALVLVFIMSFGFVTASAKGTVLSNDKFYVELPEGFEICTDYGDDHYYFENSENIYEELSIYVEGNINFPDGLNKTDEEIIENRVERFIYDKELSSIDIEKIQKGNINGISACYVYGMIEGSIDQQFLHAYVLATKENVFIVSAVIYAGDSPNVEKEPNYLKETISSFLVNGTYFNGDKLTKAHDFSKAEHYIDALERDVLTDDYFENNEDIEAIGIIGVFAIFASPIIIIVLLVLYFKTRKKLKEYKEFFGTIEQARSAMYQQQMQRGYQPYGNQQYYGYNPNMQPYNQGGYAPQQQPQQPIQSQQSQQCTNPTQTQDFYNNINE